MNRFFYTFAAAALLVLCPVTSGASEAAAPWGTATEIAPSYHDQKVVFDVTADSIGGLNSVLDRAGYLSQMNGDDPFTVKIVLVIHNDAIPFFAIKNYAKYQTLMQRAYSASLGKIIEFRMCKAAARLRGFQPKDFHGFITMVPMAEAEIARLQLEEGFAYMR